LIIKPEGNIPVGGPRRRWEDDVRIDRKEIEWEVVDWIYLTQDREQWRAVVSMAMDLRVP
jgi:hypothetical protein